MSKRRLQAMSPAETEILRIIWELEKATVQEIYRKLPRKRKIVYKTVLTMVRRLESKGYLKHETQGKANLYFAAIKREDVLRRTVLDFVDRLFGGDPGPLVQFLAEDGHIDADEFNRLKKIVDKS
jgi:predicted transcriptional regulator